MLTSYCPPVTAIPASLVEAMKRLAKCMEPSVSFGHEAYRVPTDAGLAKCVTRLDLAIPGGRIEVRPACVTTTGTNRTRQTAALLFHATHGQVVQCHAACDIDDIAPMLSRSLHFARTGE